MDNPTAAEVVARINEDREAAGLTVNALAKASGIPFLTLDRRFKGDDKVTLPELIRLSNALKTPLSRWVA